MVPNQENIMEGDKLPAQTTITHGSHCNNRTCVQEHCSGETGLPSSVFQVVHEMSLVHVLLFKVTVNYLNIQCGFIWKKTMQLVSGKVMSSMHAKFHCYGTTP